MASNEVLWEINHHWVSVGDDDSIFTGCTVTPIYVIEENIVDGATSPSILAKDSSGVKFRGSRKNFYDTEEAAWAAVREDLENSLKLHKSEVDLLTKQCEAIQSFLSKHGTPLP